MRSKISHILSVASVVFGLAYPLMVFWGLEHFSLGSVTAVILSAIMLRFIAIGISEGFQWKQAAGALGLAGLVGLWFFIARDHLGLLLVPTAINVGLLVVFGTSLLSRPIIEVFARRFDPDLSKLQQAHCREFTVWWCVFFIANGTAITLLAVLAPRAWWALYTGVISYVLMGGMFALEFIVRRSRFRQFSSHAPDQWLRQIL